MYFYTQDQIRKKLIKLGLRKGDAIFVTTSLGMIGQPKDFKKKDLNKIFLKIILDIIGTEGTIFVPTYSYSFSSRNKNKIFDVKNTRSKIGSFPNFFLRQKNIYRNNDPFVSISGKGFCAKRILDKKVYTSYGKNSVFENLLKIRNFKILNIGLGPNWTPFIHYADFLSNVDHRFEKVYEGKIRYSNKKLENIKWVYNSRVLIHEAKANAYKVGYKALKKNIWQFEELGRSRIFISSYKRYFDFSMNELKKNKWAFANGPKKNLIEEDRKKIFLKKKEKKGTFKCNYSLDGFNSYSKNLLKKIDNILKIKVKTIKTGTVFYDFVIPERKTFFKKNQYIETYDQLNFGLKEKKKSKNVLVIYLNNLKMNKLKVFFKFVYEISKNNISNLEILFIFDYTCFVHHIHENSDNAKKTYFHLNYSDKDFFYIKNIRAEKKIKFIFFKNNFKKKLINKKFEVTGKYPFYQKKFSDKKIRQVFIEINDFSKFLLIYEDLFQ